MSLETKHVVWIFDAAKEHFEELIKETEIKIMLHERFINEPFHNTLNKSREYKIAELKDYLRQYREIVAFCIDAKHKAMDMSAREFAQFFKPRV